MNAKIVDRVVSNLERLSQAALEYATTSRDAEMEIEGRFYQALANRIRNHGMDAGNIIPAEAAHEGFETYVGPGGYVMSYDSVAKGRGHRIVEQYTLSGEKVTTHPSCQAAAKACGVSASAVAGVAGGRQAMVRGMVFKYKRY